MRLLFARPRRYSQLRYKYQHRAPREPQGPGVSDVRSSIEDTLAFFDQHIDEIDVRFGLLSVTIQHSEGNGSC